jgi:hypothetical protein
VSLHGLLSSPRRVLAVAVCVAAVGCGKTSDGVAVQGRVNFQGKAFPGGVITFFPASGRPVQAIVDSDGTYHVGLQPCEYRVTLTLSVDLPSGWKEGAPLPPPPITLPAKYTKRVETPLTASVTAENKSQTIDFNPD